MKVVEIFKSLQGEGPDQGIVTTFIRLGGCNLHCRWCDTSYSHTAGSETGASEILEKVREFGAPHVCVTGGEPLLSVNDLLPLLKSLYDEGFIIEIETNGTINPALCREYATICMDIKCPSSGEKSDLSLLKYLGFDDSVKFVVADINDCEYARGVIENKEFIAKIFISPVWGCDYGIIADYVIEHRLPVKFQVQLHKVIGVK
jgi:7-carboxy-7-deazaguanine synthase